MQRAAGMLMPVSSLPSRGGIGTFGKKAFEFLDFLKESGVKVWQMLPLGPTGYGDSPYSPFSSFAGNSYFIDPEKLLEEGLITAEEFAAVDIPLADVDYGFVYNTRKELLAKAFERGREIYKPEFESYMGTIDEDVLAYVIFSVMKERNGMAAWYCWPEKERDFENAKAIVFMEHRERAEYYAFCQFLFERQFEELKAYAKKLGIALMGDIPFYAAADSADVFAARGLFRLFEDGSPREVAGVPPDYFSADGQLWGNPLYRWDIMREDGYGWWRRRVAAAAKKYDIIRLDHFRGFESFWCVAAGETTAKGGHWEKGPDKEFVDMLRACFPETQFIAEDLGDLTDDVRELLRYSGFPGMKVLQFSFYKDSDSDYLPHRHIGNSVIYTGTHDNTTLMAWIRSLTKEDREFCKAYLGGSSADLFIKAAFMSVCDLAVLPMQDFLKLGKAARINTPGEGYGNWRWRAAEGDFSDKLAGSIKQLCKTYSR